MSAMLTLPQRIVAALLCVALAAAIVFNVVQALKIRALIHANSSLDSQINDPATGYIVRLTQARTNTTVCTAAISRQNAVTRTQSERDTATIAAVQTRYDREHVARVRAEKAAAAFMARAPQGDTLTERVLDVDAQILGDLK